MSGFQAPQKWASTKHETTKMLSGGRKGGALWSGNNVGKKTSLPSISKLDSDGDSPNCSDDDDNQGTGQQDKRMDFMMAASGTEDCQATGSGRGSASRKDLIMGA